MQRRLHLGYAKSAARSASFLDGRVRIMFEMRRRGERVVFLLLLIAAWGWIALELARVL